MCYLDVSSVYIGIAIRKNSFSCILSTCVYYCILMIPPLKINKQNGKTKQKSAYVKSIGTPTAMEEIP